MGKVPKWEGYSIHPLFLRKSAEAIEAKRVPQHSLFQERGKSAEAIENNEVIFHSFHGVRHDREARVKRHPTLLSFTWFSKERLTGFAVCERLILKGM
jgi:hypothetical protein